MSSSRVSTACAENLKKLSCYDKSRGHSFSPPMGTLQRIKLAVFSQIFFVTAMN